MWRNPDSFVVIAPKNVIQTDEGGLFAKSLISVLHLERDNLKLLTVQSFTDKVQADLYGL